MKLLTPPSTRHCAGTHVKLTLSPFVDSLRVLYPNCADRFRGMKKWDQEFFIFFWAFFRFCATFGNLLFPDRHFLA